MRSVTLFILICLYTFVVQADNKSKLLPAKIFFGYKVITYTYDKSNRIKTQHTTYLAADSLEPGDNVHHITTFSYTKEGFIKRSTTMVYNSDAKLKQKKADEEYAGGIHIAHANDSLYHLISSFNITHDQGRKIKVMSLDSDAYISLETNKRPTFLTIADRDYMLYDRRELNYTYNTSENIVKYTDTKYTRRGNSFSFLGSYTTAESTEVILEYDDKQGIFKNIAINTIQKSQEEPDTFFLWNTHNVIEKLERSEDNKKTTRYEYTYNNDGYPISYTTIVDGEVLSNVYIEYKKAN